MSDLRPLPIAFYRRRPEEVARDLLGRVLIRDLDGERSVLRIVETEAYLGARDRASHAWNDRRTPRTEALFREGGFAYVYFVYGMHFMLNVVTGSAGDGSAVLIRAGAPLAGLKVMEGRRGLPSPARPGALAGGPARLCQALAIDLRLNRQRLWRGELRIGRGSEVEPGEVCRGPRVGIDYSGEAIDWPLRFAVRGDPHVSKPTPC